MKKYKFFLIALLGVICAFALSFAVACSSGTDGVDGADGKDGTNGIGIISVEKDSSSGLTDTYIITYSDGSTSTFVVTNGADGTNGTDGTTITSFTPAYDTDGTTVLSYTVKFSDGNEFTIYNGTNGTDGKDGTTITSLTPAYDTDGTTVLSYTVKFSDGNEFTILNGTNGTNGKDGTTITSLTPAYDTDGTTVLSYTVKFSDGNEFTIYNGTNGTNGADGTTITSLTPAYDTDGTTVLSYTVKFSDGNEFTIYNGTNGADGKDGTTITSLTPTYDTDGTTVLSYTVKFSDGKEFTIYNGTNGKSAYQLYCDANPTYTGDLNQWLSDLVNGNLATIEYTVTFDSDHGTAVESQTVKKGEKATEPAAPDNDDAAYTFDGWYLGNEKWSFIGYTVTEDITLTAKWVLKNKELAFTKVYDTEDNTKIVSYTVSGYSGSDAEIIIPEYYNGYPVTGISKNAFKNNSAIISVVIPDSVTSIDESAFNGCTSLGTITLPATLNTLGSTVFSNTIIDKVYYNGTLSDWLNITYGSGSSNPMFNGAQLYFTDNNGSYTLVESVTITGVTAINSSAFYGCTSLMSVTIGDGVTSVGNYAFRNCTSLTSVTIGGSVTSMGTTVFNGCSSLASMTLPFAGAEANAIEASETTVFGYIFGTSSYTDSYAAKQKIADGSTKTYYIPSTLTTVTITGCNLLYGALSKCTSLTNVTIGDGVTSIDTSAFNGCTSLETITLPATLKTLGSTVFSDTIVDKVYYNGDLYGWLNITYGSGSSNPLFNGAQLYFTDNNGDYELVESVTITGVTAINSSAFYGCTSLMSVTMGDSVTSIGSHAFRNCTSLTNVTIGGNVTSMGSNVFNNCSSLASITILVSVISIGSCSFEGCTLLKEVYYTGTASQWASMIFNDEYASPLFYGADLYLNGVIAKDITIEGVTTVNAYTFRGSTITSVTIDGNNTNIASQAFFASSLISVVISDNVKLIGHYVFTYCTSLTSIVIGSNVTYIGSNVFDDCSSLTSIYYNGTSSAYSSIDIYSTVPSSATIYFYAEEDSITAVGNYWYYDTDNNIVTWTVKDTSTEGGTASE